MGKGADGSDDDDCDDYCGDEILKWNRMMQSIKNCCEEGDCDQCCEEGACDECLPEQCGECCGRNNSFLFLRHEAEILFSPYLSDECGCEDCCGDCCDFDQAAEFIPARILSVDAFLYPLHPSTTSSSTLASERKLRVSCSCSYSHFPPSPLPPVTIPAY